jgi:hypothetical protein
MNQNTCETHYTVLPTNLLIHNLSGLMHHANNNLWNPTNPTTWDLIWTQSDQNPRFKLDFTPRSRSLTLWLVGDV